MVVAFRVAKRVHNTAAVYTAHTTTTLSPMVMKPVSLQALKSFLAEKIMRKCYKGVTFAYKNPVKSKCEQMSDLLTIFQPKEILRPLRIWLFRKF
jgi:hypothetical protein